MFHVTSLTGATLGFSYRASFICVTRRITNRCDFLYYVFISFFSYFLYMFRAFMCPSSGVFQAVVFMLPLHEPNGSIKTAAWNTPDDGPMKARNM